MPLRLTRLKSKVLPTLVFTFFILHFSFLISPVVFAAEPVPSPTGAKVSPVPADKENCLECHTLKKKITITQLYQEKPSNFLSPQAYLKTSHAKIACTDCHKGYVRAIERKTVSRFGRATIVQRHSEQEYRTYVQVATEACGDPKCHPRQKKDYLRGSHSRKVTETTSELPTCTTCHNFHYIPSLGKKVKVGGKVVRKIVSAETKLEFATLVCGSCHRQELEKYSGNYHYKALKLGNADAPMCYDCHGGHKSNALTPGTAEAVIACRQCHDNANKKFTLYIVHLDPVSRKAPPEILYANLFYIALTTVILSMAGLHTLILWQRKRREKRLKEMAE